jgi:hypothetical protein
MEIHENGDLWLGCPDVEHWQSAHIQPAVDHALFEEIAVVQAFRL